MCHVKMSYSDELHQRKHFVLVIIIPCKAGVAQSNENQQKTLTNMNCIRYIGFSFLCVYCCDTIFPRPWHAGKNIETILYINRISIMSLYRSAVYLRRNAYVTNMKMRPMITTVTAGNATTAPNPSFRDPSDFSNSILLCLL